MLDTVGSDVGLRLGDLEGLDVSGLWLGDTVGSDVGLRLGDLDGLDVSGLWLGDTVGSDVGLRVGDLDGLDVVGLWLGDTVGSSVVGLSVGFWRNKEEETCLSTIRWDRDVIGTV